MTVSGKTGEGGGSVMRQDLWLVPGSLKVPGSRHKQPCSHQIFGATKTHCRAPSERPKDPFINKEPDWFPPIERLTTTSPPLVQRTSGFPFTSAGQRAEPPISRSSLDLKRKHRTVIHYAPARVTQSTSTVNSGLVGAFVSSISINPYQ